MMNSGFMTDDEFQAKFDEYTDKMTNLQRQFAIHMASGMTQRQAYVKAGGNASSDSSKDTQASTLMRNQKVVTLYKLLLQKAMEDSVMSKTEAMQILSDTARAKISDYMTYEFYDAIDDETEEKTLAVKYTTKNSTELPPHLITAIASVTMTKYGPKFALKDSNAAIKQLSKMIGWDSPTEITTPAGKPLNVKSEVAVEGEVKEALDNLLSML